jgi:hypothetical protein
MGVILTLPVSFFKNGCFEEEFGERSKNNTNGMHFCCGCYVHFLFHFL